MIVYYIVNGCNFELGDLIGMGMIFGLNVGEFGSMFELIVGGFNFLDFGNGE